MPTVSNTALTLTTVNSDTTITVDFDTEFSEVDRNLSGLGVDYHPHIDVVGVDGAARNIVMADAFPHSTFAVTVGSTPQVISRSMSITVPRSSLQEDPAAGDNDEISCDIRIHTVGIPETFTANVASPQRTLVG